MMASVNQIAAKILTVQTDFVRVVNAFLVTVEKALVVKEVHITCALTIYCVLVSTRVSRVEKQLSEKF